MITGIFLLIACIAFGIALVKKTEAADSLEEQIIYGSTAGLAVGGIILIAASLITGFNNLTITAVAIALGLVAIASWKNKEKAGIVIQKDTAAIFLVVLVVFGYLFSTHYLELKQDGIYSAGSTWGDLAFHTIVTSSMAYGDNFPPQSPVFSGKKLDYHFAADFISATLVKTGFSLRDALILPSLMAALLAVLAFFTFSKKIIGKQGASIAVLLLLFNGGLGFYYLFEETTTGKNPFELVKEKQYTHLENKKIFFSNIIADIFLPQRPALFGFAVLFTVLGILENARKRPDRKPFLLAGLLAGTLPLIHAHSLAVIIFATAAWALLERQKNWPYFFIPALLIALPQVFWILPESGASFLRIDPGWMSPITLFDTASWINFAWFWFLNAGFLFLLAFPAYHYAGNELKKFYLPFAGLFVIANAVVFQPWQWDNIKILAYWLAATAILASTLITKLWNGDNYRKIAAIGLVFLMILSGLLSVYREATVSWQLFDNEQISLAKWARENTPQKALFLSSDQHNSFLALAGRSTYLGYKGWLWSHGINYSKREKDVQEIYANPGFASARGIDYAVIGPRELIDFRLDEKMFTENYPLVARTENYRVYDTR